MNDHRLFFFEMAFLVLVWECVVSAEKLIGFSKHDFNIFNLFHTLKQRSDVIRVLQMIFHRFIIR